MVQIAIYILAPLILLWTLYSMVRLIQLTPSAEEVRKIVSANFWASAFGTIWISLNWRQGQILLSYDIFPFGTPNWLIQGLYGLLGLLLALAFIAQFKTLRQNKKHLQLVVVYVILLVLVSDLAFFTLALDRVASDMLWGALIGVSFHQFRLLNQS